MDECDSKLSTSIETGYINAKKLFVVKPSIVTSCFTFAYPHKRYVLYRHFAEFEPSSSIDIAIQDIFDFKSTSSEVTYKTQIEDCHDGDFYVGVGDNDFFELNDYIWMTINTRTGDKDKFDHYVDLLKLSYTIDEIKNILEQIRADVATNQNIKRFHCNKYRRLPAPIRKI